jgi:O-antigen/teichoic acid export membrane protein
MILAYLITLLIILVILTVGFTTYRGWRDLLRRDRGPGEPLWRKIATFVALLLVSLALVGWVGMAIHNAIARGHEAVGAWTLPIIKSGTTLSFLGMTIGSAARGRARWTAVIGGGVVLFLWCCYGMSL